MDVPPTPGELLGQPTRARLFALLGDLRRAATTDELAETLALHPNGVRLHLERLHDAGLVDRRRERIARGRPRDLWSVSVEADPGGDPPSAYADLSRWLTRVIEEGDGSDRQLEAVGREIGRGLAPRDPARAPEARFRTALTAMGFRPHPQAATAGERHYCLGNCPYRDAVDERRKLVCGLHRGMTQGLLDVIDPGSAVVGFRPEDPQRAGCRVEIRGLADRPDDGPEPGAETPVS